MKEFLFGKISRPRSDALIAPYASDEPTLDVGARGELSYAQYFPDRTGLNIVPGPGVDVVASVYAMPFPDNHFQNVLCMSVLEHLEEPSRAVAEIRRVLKPGGRILLSVPFLFPMHDVPGDYWRFTSQGLRKLFGEGWSVDQVTAETTPQESFAVLLQRLSYQTKMRMNGPLKFCILLAARFLGLMPNMITHVFGDIQKNVSEPDAFASAFFLVAQKTETHT